MLVGPKRLVGKAYIDLPLDAAAKKAAELLGELAALGSTSFASEQIDAGPGLVVTFDIDRVRKRDTVALMARHGWTGHDEVANSRVDIVQFFNPAAPAQNDALIDALIHEVRTA